jgi:hypothetical protein
MQPAGLKIMRPRSGWLRCRSQVPATGGGGDFLERRLSEWQHVKVVGACNEKKMIVSLRS